MPWSLFHHSKGRSSNTISLSGQPDCTRRIEHPVNREFQINEEECHSIKAGLLERWAALCQTRTSCPAPCLCYDPFSWLQKRKAQAPFRPLETAVSTLAPLVVTPAHLTNSMPCLFPQLWDNTEKQALLANKSPVPTGQPLATVSGTVAFRLQSPSG